MRFFPARPAAYAAGSDSLLGQQVVAEALKYPGLANLAGGVLALEHHRAVDFGRVGRGPGQCGVLGVLAFAFGDDGDGFAHDVRVSFGQQVAVDFHEAQVALLDHVGGQLAIQQPANHDHPSHVFAREIASEEPFRTALGGWVRIAPVLPMDRYAQMLFDFGAEDMTVLEKIYPHVLENADAIAEWTSGTLLVPYFERLGDLRDAFMNAYRERLRETFPGGPIFYPFRRMLFAAHRAT